MSAKAMEWIVGGDTGMSSETIWSTMMGVKCEYPSYPLDPADAGRCFRLLDLVPEWKPRMSEMATVSPEWKSLVARWDELRASMEDEVGIDWSKGRKAEKTYRLMKQILQQNQ